MFRRRDSQPLKKRSAMLMIVSVIGNFLCFLNISACAIFFGKYEEMQNQCYFKQGMYTQECHAIGERCMSKWILEN